MVDASVGEVLAVLDRNRLTDQTLVIMTSDNGARWTPEEIRQFGHRSNLNNRGQKSDIFEGGHRIPFLVRWPGKVRAGSTSDELGCLVDLMATCAAVAGVPLPPNAAEDSFSLLPAILSKPLDRPIRDAVVHHSGSGMFAIRSGDWKLVLGLGSGGFTRPRSCRTKARRAGRSALQPGDRSAGDDERLRAASRNRPLADGKAATHPACRPQPAGGIVEPVRCRFAGRLAKLALPQMRIRTLIFASFLIALVTLPQSAVAIAPLSGTYAPASATDRPAEAAESHGSESHDPESHDDRRRAARIGRRSSRGFIASPSCWRPWLEAGCRWSCGSRTRVCRFR